MLSALFQTAFGRGSEHDGRLVVCIASKGEMYDVDVNDSTGVVGLGELAHRYGFPVTFYLKPFTAARASETLRRGFENYGDEVGWYAENTGLSCAADELAELRRIVSWADVRSAAQLHYGSDWVGFFGNSGISSVWGRCYEQTATDGITDRGCPFGFYYLDPDCFKVPSKGKGGIVSVPWLSNDVNLVYHTAQQSTFTFDVNDPQDIGMFSGNLRDESFWEVEITEYLRQTRYNRVVPLVIQQEIGEFVFSGNSQWRLDMKKDGAVILETLFRVLKRRGIEVVTVSEAVDIYRKAYPMSTPPTYAVFGNIAKKLPAMDSLPTLVPVGERFSVGNVEKYRSYGTHFNGYYATGRVDREWYYYSPEKLKLSEFPKTLTYYDMNGLLVFEEGRIVPSRITPYSNLPEDAHVTAILPELSKWFDTAKYIPDADVRVVEKKGALEISVTVEYSGSILSDLQEMPYGIMLWGNRFDKCRLVGKIPAGARILEGEGLFVPLLLKHGVNKFNYRLRIL